MEAMLGISLYNYLYPKLAKMICLSYVFSSTKSEKRAEQILPGRWGGGTMYTHVSKCKNDKIKGEKKKK
jgi:hypothetical protein